MALPKQFLKQASRLLSTSTASSWTSSNFLTSAAALPFAASAAFKSSSSSSSSSTNWSDKARINLSTLLSASFASLASLDALSAAAPSSSSPSFSAENILPIVDSSGELLCAFVNEKAPGKLVSEDVHFISEELGVLAVFDGVGGWKGITRPEAFPLALRQGLEHTLKTHFKHPTPNNSSPTSPESPAQAQANLSSSHKSHHSRSHSHSHVSNSPESLHSSASPSSSPLSLSPSHLLSRAHEFAKHEVELGSSTACLIVVDKLSGKFDSANLGDSGWYLFKSSTKKIELWSEEQQHYWNCPYQIGGSKSKADKVDMADLRGEVCLDDGDIILLATDGLSDNLFREEINAVIANKFHSKLSRDELNDIAKDLYHEAHKKFDALSNTPFRENYYKHTKKHQRHSSFFEGSYGKPDDVAVIIAQFSKANADKKPN